MKSIKHKRFLTLLCALALLTVSCDNTTENKNNGSTDAEKAPSTEQPTKGTRRYAGALTNGMKGDSIFFTISEDGKKLKDLTFKGYWRCSGKLEQTTVGPEGFFEVKNGVVNSAVVEPPDGGSTAWRFELQATIGDDKATGSFRMNINNLGCDTYKLNFTAAPR